MRRNRVVGQAARWFFVGVAAVSPVTLVAAQASGPVSASGALPLASAPADTAYRLGSGDRVRIDVYNEDTMSGEYEVDGSGIISLQLIGPVSAAGKTVPELNAAIADRLKEGYLLKPSVAIQVLSYRPFYVLGEVKLPGKYPYVSRMTVLNAIALAGGYTYRGKRSRAMVIHAIDPEQKEQPAGPGDFVAPGDIIRVPERIF